MTAPHTKAPAQVALGGRSIQTADRPHDDSAGSPLGHAIEALGIEAPSAQNVEKWQTIATAVLPRLLMDDGTVALTVSDAGYIR
ncbi:hypothetical protein KJ059_00760 [Myxococcota bacterium]|nr:hypothetical protein [Myxococcota bacterium]